MTEPLTTLQPPPPPYREYPDGSLRCFGRQTIAPVTPPPTSSLRVYRADAVALGVPDVETAAVGSLPVGDAVYQIPATGVIYVDAVTGSDADNGSTTALAVKTFPRAYALVAAGGTIVMRAGNYHVGVTYSSGRGTDDTSGLKGYAGFQLGKANITIQNYPGEAAWFDGSSTYNTGWSADGGYYSRSWVPFRRDPQFGWVYTGTYPPPGNTWSVMDDQRQFWNFVDYTNWPTAAWPERVWIDGVPQVQVNLLSNMGAGKFYADAYNNKLYVSANPSGKTVTITDLQTCMSLLADGITVRGVGYRRYANSNPMGGALKALRDSPTFENIVVEDTAASGINMNGSSSNIGPNNGVVRNVTLRRCNNLGMSVGSVSNITFDNLLVEYNNCAHFNYSPAAGGVKIHATRGASVKNSLFTNNYGKGLWFDEDNYDTPVISCDFINNEQRSMVFELNGPALMVDCYFKNNGADDVRVLNCEKLEMWNCTFIGSGRLRGAITDNGGPRIIRQEGDDRSPRNQATSVGIDGRAKAGSIPPWPTSSAIGWMPRQAKLRNCVLGRGNVQSMFASQEFRTFAWESYTTKGVDLQTNYYDASGVGTAGPLVQYPWILSNAASGSNTIVTSLAQLRGLGFETTGIFNLGGSAGTDANGKLTNQATADAAATALPANIAAWISRPTGTKRMGAWRTNL